MSHSSESIDLPVKLLNEFATLPKKMTAGSAGFDLYSPQDATIQPNSDFLLKLGISIAIPTGFHGQIWPRSGLDLKYRITTGAGMIDSDYRDELGILLRNLSNTEYNIKRGDRVGQIVFVQTAPINNCISVSSLEATRREGGFGSTGIN